MIRIYHTSDLHDRRHIAAPLRRLRAETPGLLVDCGDALRGSQTVYLRREPIVDELDAAGYDVTAMGNREFHYLFGLVGRAVAQDAPSGRVRQPGRRAPAARCRSRPMSLLRARRRAKSVRFFGLLVPQYPDGSPWERVFGWRFLDPVAVATEIARTTPPGVTLVALSHLGLRADRELAARVPQLDLILGGHSHDTLPEPEIVNGVPIVHAGPYGAFASRTELRARRRTRAYRRLRAAAARDDGRAVLFVTNGHGEAAIAARIARERARARRRSRTEHWRWSANASASPDFPDVGPQRAMPSGGLVAMGNVRAFARDLGAGWLGLFAAQLRFLRSARGRYAAVVAVGDAYAAALARLARRPWIFVGTAKSEYVALVRAQPNARSSQPRPRASSCAMPRRPMRCAGAGCVPKRRATSSSICWRTNGVTRGPARCASRCCPAAANAPTPMRERIAAVVERVAGARCPASPRCFRSRRRSSRRVSRRCSSGHPCDRRVVRRHRRHPGGRDDRDRSGRYRQRGGRRGRRSGRRARAGRRPSQRLVPHASGAVARRGDAGRTGRTGRGEPRRSSRCSTTPRGWRAWAPPAASAWVPARRCRGDRAGDRRARAA